MNKITFFVFMGFFLSSASSRSLFDHNIFPSFNLSSILDAERHRSKLIENKVCSTDACKKIAKNILDSIESKIDPCEDFYSYVCARWIRNHPVPPTENSWSQFGDLDKKLNYNIRDLLEEKMREDEPDIVKTVKKVYSACMDTERIEQRGVAPLTKLLEEFNNWPMTTSDWTEENFDWQKLIGDVARKLAINSIILLHVDVDRKNTSRNVIIIDEPSLVLPRYLLTFSDISFVEPYVTFIYQAAKLVAALKPGAVSLFSLYDQSFDVVEFEVRLAKIMRKEEDKRNANDLYHLVSIEKLQEWTNGKSLRRSSSRIQWLPLIMNHLGVSEEDITPNTLVDVTNWHYFENLMNLIDKTPPRVVANYILWRVVNKMSRDVNQEMTELNFRFKTELSSVTEDYPRWYDCVLTSGYLSFAVGYLYVQRHFDAEAKAKAVEMVEDIRNAFKQELSEVQWMDEETRKEAMEKADFMNYFIGYPDWYDNVTVLEEYYRGLKIGKDHFENKLALREFLANKFSENFKSPTNREEWQASPAIVNAFYHPHLNSIIFPAGVLQEPFFSKNQPEALNYGSIGTVVGHEITHGFDDLGRQSDKLGNIKEWWSKETEKTYLENAFCFINQYQNYRIPELDALLHTKVKMNGLLTLSENIADNGGLSAALRAYQAYINRTGGDDFRLPGLEHFTSEQLFYIGFARTWCESSTESSLLAEVLGDSHSPQRLRVVGSVSNSEHFAATWKCKSGSNMNPEKKCDLW